MLDRLYKFLFFLPYPQAVIWHALIGSVFGAILGALFAGYRGEGYLWPVSGALAVVGLGLALFKTHKQ